MVESFKEMNGLEVVVSLLTKLDSEETKGAFFVCLKLLSQLEFDLLSEMAKLGIIDILMDELETAKNPYTQWTILQVLVNLSMNDMNSIYMRQSGLGTVGQKMLFTNEGDYLEICESPEEAHDIVLKIEVFSLMFLRYLYSVEKNRKAFKLVFPPEIFGPFIDIGNYQSDWERYENCLEKLSSIPEPDMKAIVQRLSEMR